MSPAPITPAKGANEPAPADTPEPSPAETLRSATPKTGKDIAAVVLLVDVLLREPSTDGPPLRPC